MRRHIKSVAVLVLVYLCVLVATGAGAEVVRELHVEGNEHVSRDRVLLGFGVRIGADLAAEDVREGIRRLYEMGHFSDVQVFGERSGEDSIDLTIAVVERPRVSAIEIVGNDKVGDSDIEDLLRLESGLPFDTSRLEDSRVAVLRHYEEKGFPYASVTAEVEDLPGNAVRVVLQIEESTRVNVRAIRFEGNEAIEDVDLKKVMETKEDRWWRTDAFLDTQVLEADFESIEARYREEGYIDARVLGHDTEYEDDGKKVNVTIRVDEGALYEVSSIEWNGASEFAVDALYDLTDVEIGDTYRPGAADEVIREAYGWYGERGYIHARIYKVEDVETGNQLSLRFYVDEAEPAHVGRIHIAGNTRTKEHVIRRELTVKPGDLYRTSEVLASQRKIANLGFFNGPFVDFGEGDSPSDVDLIFEVEERQTGRAGVGVTHTSEKGITGFLELTEGNLFGNGQYFDVTWEFGKESTELVLGFTEPWFLGRRLSFGFDIYDTEDQRSYGLLDDSFYEEVFPEDVADEILGYGDDASRYYVIKRERRGGDLRLGWPFLGSRNSMMYVKYTLEQVKIQEYANVYWDVTDTSDVVTDTDSKKFVQSDPGWEWRRGLTTTFTRRTTDRRFHPHDGSYTRGSAELFGWVFGGDVEYQRYIVDTRKYVPSFWRTTLMLRGRGGLVTGFGDPTTVPTDTRFELGGVGINGIRGYDNRSILPEGSELYGGRTMLLGSAELKFPITDEREQLPVYGLFFVDAGNTWNSGEDTHPTQLYWGAGAGARVEVPVLGTLGVDMGYGFDDELGGEWVVHYQFGLDF